MPSEISPRRIMEAVEQGHKRLSNFRRARMLYIRQMVGQFYDQTHGKIGNEPLNLIFNAIRVLVPNLIFNFPVHNVTTRFLAYRDYGEMLSMALSLQDKQLGMREIYRRWLVDAIFQIGILKTGICDSGTAIDFEQDDQIDPGTVYTENVSFDNFVIDPHCRRIEESMFIGDRIQVPRNSLLESGLYDESIVKRLPSLDRTKEHRERAAAMSKGSVQSYSQADAEDLVEICELWVPRAKALVTVPGDFSMGADDYLRITDYYGPDSGPYTYLSLTPPVPDNPIPVSMVGIWYDLHMMANRMAKKIMDQADRQKSLIGYKRSSADDAQMALDANDGEAIAMDDPQGVVPFNFGGQQQSNEAHVAQLQMWFNMMAGNPEGISGLSMNSKSATEANILQGNAQTSMEDMRDLTYAAVAAEARKRAWYLHTDPLLEVPMIRRVHQPGQYITTPQGGMIQTAAPMDQEVQVYLTPEARCGEFLDYTFEIQPESMGRIDSQKRLAQALDFAVKILPAAAQAAQTCTAMGIPFSFPRFVERMAKEAGITWMEEVFQDPEFIQRMALLQQRGPQEGPSKGTTPNVGLAPAVAQNGQPGQVMGGAPTPQEAFNSTAQAGANEGQSAIARSGY